METSMWLVGPVVAGILLIIGILFQVMRMLGRLEEGLRNLERSHTVFRAETREEFKAVREEFKAVRAEFREDIAELRGKFEELRGKVEELSGDVRELRGKFGELRGDVRELRGKVEELSGNVRELRGKFGELSGDVRELRGKVGELTGDVGELRGKVEELSGDVGELRGDVGELQVAVGECAKAKDMRAAFQAMHGEAHGDGTEVRGKIPKGGGDFAEVRDKVAEVHPGADGHGRQPSRESSQASAMADVRGQSVVPERASGNGGGAKFTLPGDIAVEKKGALELTAKGKAIATTVGAADWVALAAGRARQRLKAIEEDTGARMSPPDVQWLCFDFTESFGFDEGWIQRIQEAAFENGQPVETVRGVMALALRDRLLDMGDNGDSPELES